MKKKVIIDVDTGIDDALAISYILSNNDADLIGITTTFGNVFVEVATQNSLDLLKLFDRNDIEVYQGASHNCTSTYFDRPERLDIIHGKNGIGEVVLDHNDKSVNSKAAAEYIVESARKYGAQLNLLCVGPLTNLADALKMDPSAIKSIGNITIMGGALTVRGNRSLYAEANIFSDAVAAKYIFDSPLLLNIIPLDTTWQTLIQLDDIACWKSGEKSNKLYQMSEFYYNNEFLGKNSGGALHDPLAAEAILNPEIISNWFSTNLTIELEENSYGRMIGNMELLNIPKKKHRVALEVKKEEFLEKFISKIDNHLN